MKPNFKYIQKVSRAFHLSSAFLESGQYAKLYLTVNSNKSEVASLTHTVRQRDLDLNFLKGDKLIFHIVGKGDITLVGYTLPCVGNDSDDDVNDDDDDYDDGGIEVEEESDASEKESDDDNGPPKKKLRLSIGQGPNSESNEDDDMEMGTEDADGYDVKMNIEDN
ncbi:39 kDa FK506-binding nuclear protein-like [Drosophila innubila]|uniref:39 kDa FK506-binding nuclear protein-like n=1 Tax=Drosophila innubila TaxID=198719 RepID=UPI00148E0BB5|nr:39 kDa FK506-binding nuclear protein-like [Drosophila innubila]